MEDGRNFQPHMEPLFNRMDIPKHQANETMHRVCADILNFHVKMDMYVFQDWLISLDDYFNWFFITADHHVCFIKMKLKGQARIWWQSVKKQFSRLHQPPIADREKMKLKL